MPEGTEETEEKQSVESPEPEGTEQPEGTTETPVEEPDEGKEPGGDDPQAVRARKEYRTRKRIQEELEQERLARIRAEERAKAIEEAGKTSAKPEKVWSIAEINAAVEEGKVTRADADRYIEDVIMPRKFEAWSKTKETEQQQKAPIERARQDISEYKKFIPSLSNPYDSEFQKAAAKFEDLRSQGLPDNAVTERLAVELTFGDLDKLKKKAEIDAMNRERGGQMPVDAGAGGPRNPGNGKLDLSKAPPTYVAAWDREGLDQVTRERRYRIYLNLKAKQSGR